MRFINNDYINGIKNLAQEYIKIIKQYQEHGPYNLLGWSYGGLLAFEIAHQLKKEGETINNMYILDTHLITKKSKKISTKEQKRVEKIIKNSIDEKYGNWYNIYSLIKLLTDFNNNLNEDTENYNPDFYDGKLKLFKSILKKNPETLKVEKMSLEEIEKDYYNGFNSHMDIKNIEVYESNVEHFSMGFDDEFLELLSKIIEEDYNVS